MVSGEFLGTRAEEDAETTEVTLGYRDLKDQGEDRREEEKETRGREVVGPRQGWRVTSGPPPELQDPPPVLQPDLDGPP